MTQNALYEHLNPLIWTTVRRTILQPDEIVKKTRKEQQEECETDYIIQPFNELDHDKLEQVTSYKKRGTWRVYIETRQDIDAIEADRHPKSRGE